MQRRCFQATASQRSEPARCPGDAPDPHHRHGDDIATLRARLDGPLDWTLFGLWLTMLLNRHGDSAARQRHPECRRRGHAGRGAWRAASGASAAPYGGLARRRPALAPGLHRRRARPAVIERSRCRWPCAGAADLWNEYMDPKFSDRAPRMIKDTMARNVSSSRSRSRFRPAGFGGAGAVGARQGVVVEDDGIQGGQAGRLRPACPDARHGRGRHRRGVPVSVARAVLRRDPRPGARRRGCRAYNRWLADYCNPIRTGCSASRCCRCNRSTGDRGNEIREEGTRFKGGLIRPNPYHGSKMIDEPMYEPFWAAAEDLDIRDRLP